MNREDVDRFLAEADDVITDWEGSGDSASWSGDGSHEEPVIRGHYRDIPAGWRDVGYTEPGGVAFQPRDESTDLRTVRDRLLEDVFPHGAHRRDPAREAERRRRHDNYQSDEAEWLAMEYPPEVEGLPGRDTLWPMATPDAWPGRYHTGYSEVDRVRLWRFVMRSPAGTGQYLEPQRVEFGSANPWEVTIQPRLARVRRFGNAERDLSWPVLVDDLGRACGPVWRHQIQHGPEPWMR